MASYTASCLAASFPPPITIVNIGIMWGATMWCLRSGAPDAHLVGVDININRDPQHTIYYQELLNAQLIEADSTTYRFSRPIHLLFIDGCHEERVVAADIRNWTPHVVIGGIAAFHDYNPALHDRLLFPEIVGVRNAVDNWYNSSSDQWELLGFADSIIAFRRIAKQPYIPIPIASDVPKWITATATTV